MSAPDLSVYDNDPTLYLVTSLTAGSSHIISATSRMETILRANKIPFEGVDTATDDRMRSLWGRRARGKKFPGLVREGFLLGDLEQVEEWNEFGELHENIPTIGKGPAAPAAAPKAAPAEAPVSIPTNAKQKVEKKPPAPVASGPPQTLAMRQMVQEAADKAKNFKAGKDKDKEDKSPVTPIKLGRIDHSKPKLPPSDLRSPKSTPIPESPALKSPRSPVSESGVGISMDEQAAKPKQTHRGSSVSVASQEDIKRIEDEQKIDEEDEDESGKEESSEEEKAEEEHEDTEDGEDEDSDEDVDEKSKKRDEVSKQKDEEEDDDDDDEDGSDDDSDEDESPQPAKTTTATTTSAKPPTTTPAEPTATTKAAATTSSQPAASAAHAGQSVGD